MLRECSHRESIKDTTECAEGAYRTLHELPGFRLRSWKHLTHQAGSLFESVDAVNFNTEQFCDFETLSQFPWRVQGPALPSQVPICPHLIHDDWIRQSWIETPNFSATYFFASRIFIPRSFACEPPDLRQSAFRPCPRQSRESQRSRQDLLHPPTKPSSRQISTSAFGRS